MPPGTHPAARRITWLIIIIGASAAILAIVAYLFNPGPESLSPFASTPDNSLWLFVFGLVWLGVGLIMLRWLQPASAETEDKPSLAAQLAQAQATQVARLTDLDTRVKGLGAQIDSVNSRMRDLEQALQSAKPSEARDLDSELGSLATSLQEAHTRIDNLGDLSSRVQELESQLDSLYVTLQDLHQRIDGLERGT